MPTVWMNLEKQKCFMVFLLMGFVLLFCFVIGLCIISFWRAEKMTWYFPYTQHAKGIMQNLSFICHHDAPDNISILECFCVSKNRAVILSAAWKVPSFPLWDPMAPRLGLDECRIVPTPCPNALLVRRPTPKMARKTQTLLKNGQSERGLWAGEKWPGREHETSFW